MPVSWNSQANHEVTSFGSDDKLAHNDTQLYPHETDYIKPPRQDAENGSIVA